MLSHSRRKPRLFFRPSFYEERMTLDPLRPMTSDAVVMADRDAFCFAYNEFAVVHGGKCTFNQTKVLSKSQVERASATSGRASSRRENSRIAISGFSARISKR